MQKLESGQMVGLVSKTLGETQLEINTMCLQPFRIFSYLGGLWGIPLILHAEKRTSNYQRDLFAFYSAKYRCWFNTIQVRE